MSIVSEAVCATPPRFKAGQRVIVPTKKNRSVGLFQDYGLDENYAKVLKRTRAHWLPVKSLRLAD